MDSKPYTAIEMKEVQRLELEHQIAQENLQFVGLAKAIQGTFRQNNQQEILDRGDQTPLK